MCSSVLGSFQEYLPLHIIVRIRKVVVLIETSTITTIFSQIEVGLENSLQYLEVWSQGHCVNVCMCRYAHRCVCRYRFMCVCWCGCRCRCIRTWSEGMPLAISPYVTQTGLGGRARRVREDFWKSAWHVGQHRKPPWFTEDKAATMWTGLSPWSMCRSQRVVSGWQDRGSCWESSVNCKNGHWSL